ncbi:hypothetical protein BGZ76_005691, partial [Entomortierella beljakovae]
MPNKPKDNSSSGSSGPYPNDNAMNRTMNEQWENPFLNTEIDPMPTPGEYIVKDVISSVVSK